MGGQAAWVAEALPMFVEPQLACQATVAPTGAGWVHELKLDGYRVQARVERGEVKLLTRSGLDWAHRMPGLVAEVRKLPVETALLDGEVVVLGEDGNTSFAALQAAFQAGAAKAELTYFVFDLLHLNGRGLRGLSLLERKALLEGVLAKAGPAVRYCEHLESDAGVIFHKACELGAEGIVSKRTDAGYVSGRSSAWVKLKCVQEQEFVVGGFTEPGKGHAGSHGIGSLLLGYYEAGGKLVYAGRTGTGFTQATHSALRTQLEELRVEASAFAEVPGDARRGAIWVKPELVAQVRFATWTADHLLRQASFQGLREDKAASEVVREVGAAKPRAARVQAKAKPAAGAPVRLTHPGKVVDAESGLTKQQLADYYWSVAPRMLREIDGRPLSLVRCPQGTGKPCFFQKHTQVALPAGVGTVQVPDRKTGKLEPYITIHTAEALAGVAQMGVLEVHPWGSRNEDLERPDRLVIDLDPDAAIAWKTLAAVALEVRKRLKALGLESFVKTTGGKGLHVVVPMEAVEDWAVVKEFAHRFAVELERSNPALYLTKMTKAARVGKIYVDYLRNERGATAVAAYSPRARAGVPVALPLGWAELKGTERPVFRVVDFKRWKGRLGRDVWKGMGAVRQRLGKVSG